MRKALPSIAVQGVRQRVTRPVAAASLDTLSAGYSVESMQRDKFRMGFSMMLSTGLLLAAAAWGTPRLNHSHSRDSGFGLILGALLSVFAIFFLPAVTA